MPGGLARTDIVRWYFALTPIFAVIDLAFGVSVRAAWIPSIGWRVAYYGFAMGCFLLMRSRPGWTPWIGLGESSVNMLLLLLSILGPLFALPAAIEAGEPIAYGFGPERLVNVLLSGCVIILSIHRHEAALANLADRRPRR
jgi:hypothetical protein